MSRIRKMVISAMLCAVGVILPLAFHSVPNGGLIFLPMHIPVLLCGLICGMFFGFVCGVITPLLSHLITGMPIQAFLPVIMCELAVYGVVSALLVRIIPVKNRYARIYTALIGAMLFGRIVKGVVNSFIFQAGEYSIQAWITVSFVTALPGILIQLIFIPSIIIVLQKTSASV